MANGKYQRWVEEDGLTLLEGWARDGLTDKEMAGKMGIAERTLYDWEKKYPQILQAIKKGKEVVDYAVESALLKKALSGDVGACCFWLKNRRPDRWKDKQKEQEAGKEVGVVIFDDIPDGDAEKKE